MNIVHVYQLCSEYFKYDVTTNVQLFFPDQIEIPAVTMCFSIVETINWEKTSKEQRRKILMKDNKMLIKYNFDKETTSGIQQIKQLLTNSNNEVDVSENARKCLTTSELFNVTSDAKEMLNTFILNGLVVKNNVDNQPLLKSSQQYLNQWFHIQEFLLMSNKCFKLELRNNDDRSRVISQDKQVYGYQRHLIAWITKGISIIYYISPNDDTAMISDPAIVVHPSREVDMTFEIYESKLQQHPHASNCRDYSLSGFKSRKECKHQCLKLFYISKRNISHMDSNVYSGDPEKTETTYNLTEFSSARDACNAQCSQKDCFRIIYSPRIVTDWARKVRDNNSYIETQLSTNPVTRTEEQPAIPLSTFLTNVFSTFGFWLGMSVIGSISVVMKVVNNACQIGSIKRSINQIEKKIKRNNGNNRTVPLSVTNNNISSQSRRMNTWINTSFIRTL